jgi:hypothetical protein
MELCKRRSLRSQRCFIPSPQHHASSPVHITPTITITRSRPSAGNTNTSLARLNCLMPGCRSAWPLAERELVRGLLVTTSASATYRRRRAQRTRHSQLIGETCHALCSSWAESKWRADTAEIALGNPCLQVDLIGCRSTICGDTKLVLSGIGFWTGGLGSARVEMGFGSCMNMAFIVGVVVRGQYIDRAIPHFKEDTNITTFRFRPYYKPYHQAFKHYYFNTTIKPILNATSPPIHDVFSSNSIRLHPQPRRPPNAANPHRRSRSRGPNLHHTTAHRQPYPEFEIHSRLLAITQHRERLINRRVMNTFAGASTDNKQ